ncbi:SusD/RagB family nutrient-binding outer membrane lipoprotein [Sphingobacteriaceae bacterium GW460-11-11-14-LB5]|nr:SusD/RagB family nutrient-binding outer membrane lipoprotein [Sphingobacteriaceae bacterium GW460-11-11-14-LB5]
MNNKNRYITKQLLLTIIIATIGLSGCKKFLDVNENPNSPDSAAPNLLLPVSQAATGQIVGNFFQIYGNIWGQYWTQNPTSSQYRTVDQYNPAATAFDRPWLILYRNALINADLITKAQGSSLEYTKGIAYLMKAYTLQVVTDAFGDVPNTEALKPELFPAPKYDTQAVVYDSVFNYIDKGLALVSVANSASPGAQDMVFQGNMANWKAFANTLKLKAYLRLAYVDAAKAAAGVKALYATNPTFLTVDASIKYLSTGGNENPLYNEMVGLSRVQNVVASTTAVSHFDANSDPRVAKFYDLIATDVAAKTERSIIQGSYNVNTGKTVSPPSALVGARASNSASAVAPVKFISETESYFLQAEAVSRGWTNGVGTVATLYAKGIQASFTAVGAGDATSYIATAPDGAAALATNALKAIITQKYYAMCGFQGFEAWTEWRRTGYPDFFVVSIAPSRGLPQGKFPLRMAYPNTEATSNKNFPGVVTIDTPVWWDKN